MDHLQMDDYLKSRSKVMERCKELLAEKTTYEQQGQFEKVAKIQAHIDWMLEMVAIFEDAYANDQVGDIQEQE